MKVTEGKTEVQTITSALKDIKAGEVVRFSYDSIEEAFKADLFYMKLETPGANPGRVRLVNITSGKVTEYDDIHRVVTHKAELHLFNL